MNDDVYRYPKLKEGSFPHLKSAAAKIQPLVRQMTEQHGVYVCGDTNHPEATVIIVSMAGKLYSVAIDEELRPDGFLDTFVARGPFRRPG